MDFDNLHEDIRTYIRYNKLGFHIRPLLDILDIVARAYSIYPMDLVLILFFLGFC